MVKSSLEIARENGTDFSECQLVTSSILKQCIMILTASFSRPSLSRILILSDGGLYVDRSDGRWYSDRRMDQIRSSSESHQPLVADDAALLSTRPGTLWERGWRRRYVPGARWDNYDAGLPKHPRIASQPPVALVCRSASSKWGASTLPASIGVK